MEQNFSNHSRIVKGYHGILTLLLLAGLIGSIFNLASSVGTDNLPLKAQDRAIRAEENFRHYLLTQKTLPANLKMEQIIALRFASDEEFPSLTERSIQENMTGKEIKQAIKKWKADYNRV
jgi:hypothetical protein